MEKAVGTIIASGDPLEELRQLVERLERQEDIRKAMENQKKLAALGRYFLDPRDDGRAAS